MSGLLALVEHEAGRPDRLSLEALTIAGRLGAALGTPVHAALLGTGADVTAAGLGAFGVATAHVIAHDRLDAYAPAAWAAALGQVVDAGSFDAVIAPGSERGTEARARGHRRDVSHRPPNRDGPRDSSGARRRPNHAAAEVDHEKPAFPMRKPASTDG